MATIILGAQSNVWTQLTLPNPPSGAVPFVWTDNTTIAADPDNFSYDSVQGVLNLQTIGLSSINSGAAAPIVTANSGSGFIKFGQGNSTITIQNSLVETGDIVLLSTVQSSESVGGGATLFIPVCTNGFITITSNNAATNILTLAWVLIKAAS